MQERLAGSSVQDLSQEILMLEFEKAVSCVVRSFLAALARGNDSQKNAGSPRPESTPDGKSQKASELLERMEGLPFASQQKLILEDSSFHTWSVEELLCRRSIRAAGEDPKEAIRLAELAGLVSRHVPGEEPRRRRFQGYALAHLGNAFRAGGDIPEAERAFNNCDALWLPGNSDDSIDEAVVYGLEASFRRTQGNFEEAFRLHDLALQAKGATDMRAELLVSKAYTLDECGDLAGMVTCLEEARESLTGNEDGRLLLALRHNLADALSKAGRFDEAKALLPEVKRIAGKVGSELDFARMGWVEGRIEAGLGNLERGAKLLLIARGALAAKAIPFDTALVTLEIALLYSTNGQDERVRDIARHLAPIFRAQALPRETLAALTLFRQAAEARTFTAQLAGRLLDYLRKARANPGLAFEEGA